MYMYLHVFCSTLTFSGLDRFSKTEVMREAIPLGKRAEINNRMFLTARSCDMVASCDRVESCNGTASWTELAILE